MARRYKGVGGSNLGDVCTLCAKPLDPATTVWLELSCTDGHYRRPGELPAGHQSQGEFPFGSSCGPAELAYTNRKVAA